MCRCTKVFVVHKCTSSSLSVSEDFPCGNVAYTFDLDDWESYVD